MPSIGPDSHESRSTRRLPPRLRIQHGWTQTDVARRLRSSQSRVAKMEAADASISVDLLVRSLLTLGASRTEVGRVIARAA
ncbi:MAG: helix-turn-helix domain-containing protein [Thermoleophilia bacterium]|nr:helix-turn-helix domain-containing protein [Thermoleophilia bacterium]